MNVDNPFLQMLGVELIQWSDGQVELALPVLPHLNNRIGRIQGGVLATMLDAAAGYAGIYAAPGLPEVRSVTLALSTNFLDSGAGARLRAMGRLRKRGRSVFFSEAEVWLDDHLLMATAVGTFKYLKAEPGPKSFS